MAQRIQLDDDTDVFMDALDEYINDRIKRKNEPPQSLNKRSKTKLYKLIWRLLRNVDAAGSAGGGGYG
ncbi:MAG TPA: hypothetical protein VNX68_00515 [Nitrosopumilaceae archaeon]|jgi:hypothetical protein|nr:hypothetical protein [Nitrosopumilaceae archaeon]